MGLLNGFTKGNNANTTNISIRAEHKCSLSSHGTQTTHGLDDSDEVMIGVLSRKTMSVRDDGSVNRPIDTESESGDSPLLSRATYDMPSSSAAPSRPSLADGNNAMMAVSQRWAPKSTKKGGDSSSIGGGSGTLNRRAAFGKMKSSSSVFSSFRRKSISSDVSSIASSKPKRPSQKQPMAERSASHVSNLSCDSFAMSGGYDTSDRSGESADFLAFLEEAANSKESIKPQQQGHRVPTFREPLTENSHSSSSSRDVPLPMPVEGLCRPRTNSVASSASSMGSFTDDELNDLDMEASPAILDSKTMLEKLGPCPTPKDLANVAAVCANEYINEHLFADDNGLCTTLDRKKWESIPQYSKSEMAIRKHLGKGTFSDAFEVSVMVEVEDESKKLEDSDRDDLDRILEARFKGSFKSSFKKEENDNSTEKLGESVDEPDDLDDLIDTMFSKTTLETQAKKVTIQEPEEFKPAQVSPRKVSIEDLTDFKPAQIAPRAANRRPHRRRQTVDLGGGPPSFSASVCMGSLNKMEAFEEKNNTSTRVVKKKQMIYAMKCLRPQIRSNADQFIVGVEDLVHETAMLASLDHPNIIKLHGRAGSGLGGLANGFRLSDGYFILIDKLRDTLEDRIKGWKTTQGGGIVVPSVSQVKTAHKLASALTYLHSKNIIFRDLKPGNVGFDSMGELKLFDFGFALGLSGEEKDKERPLTEVCGTPRYMAPEVALGDGYGLSADVHSFAMLLWEICSLKKPFSKIKSQSDFRKTVYERGGRPKLSKYWPPILKDTLRNSWSSFPGERPTMEAVKNSLAAYQAEMSSQQKKKGHHSVDSLRKSSVFRRLSG